MKLQFRRADDPYYVLGAGEYSVSHGDDTTISTGLWADGEIVALLVDKNVCSSERIEEVGDEIVGRVNAFDTLVRALVVAEQALNHSVNAVSADEQKEAIATVRKALEVADLS